MPAEAASAAATVVMHGTAWRVAVRRMWSPSARGPRPRGVFTTRSTLPDALGSPVSLDYYDRAPFPFEGTIHNVNVRYHN